MADLEVENTLREIRERVLADAQRRAPATTNGVAGAPAAHGAEAAVTNGHAAPSSEALARMEANLATTARAWSRLPPLLSYRRGAAARFELWLKRLVKRAAHWFTWEQVNFNSAVHHALGDARAALAAQEQALARAREEFLGELRALRAEGEADRARAAELQARLARAEARAAEAQARFESGGAQLRQAFAAGLERIAESQRASADALREELWARAGALHAETNARAAELHAELRERVDDLLEEQRVCFKQLSLEAGEAAVSHDRARRQIEARLEALEKK
jgi:small-conductance mechanosensitive channel